MITRDHIKTVGAYTLWRYRVGTAVQSYEITWRENGRTCFERFPTLDEAMARMADLTE